MEYIILIWDMLPTDNLIMKILYMILIFSTAMGVLRTVKKLLGILIIIIIGVILYVLFNNIL